MKQYSRGYRRRGNSSKIIGLTLLIIFFIGVYYIYTSKYFEREKPIINISKKLYWNPSNNLNIKIEDNTGITSYSIQINTNKGKKLVTNKKLSIPVKNLTINLKNSGIGDSLRNGELSLVITANDNSKWNFFMGNKAVKHVKLMIDKKDPVVNVLSNSISIKKGGSAVVIFNVKDLAIDNVYVRVNKNIFKPQTFIKNGYYITLFAWPLKYSSFRAIIIAKDKAGNILKKLINIKPINYKYPKSNIKLTNKFLKYKIKDIANSSRTEETNIKNSYSDIDNFILVNENLRRSDENSIIEHTSFVDINKVINNFNIDKFKPLTKGAIVAVYGGTRAFMRNGKTISGSIHRGLDLASIINDNILVSNPGTIVYTHKYYDYGNTVILSHGLGLYSSYSHMAQIDVEKGIEVTKGSTLGITGKTGLALGDHLHFGVYIQGVFVNPTEWVNPKWIKYNLIYRIEKAEEIINKEM